MTTPVTTNRCPHCGTELPLEARFCLFCGQSQARAAGPDALAASSGARGAPPGSAALVGRDHELGALLGAIRRLTPRDGSVAAGGALFLVGEPGLGKSRLLDEARRAAPELRWLQASGDPTRQLRPYGLLAELVERAAGPALDDALRSLLPSVAAELLPYLETLIGRPVPGARLERVRFLQPQDLRQQMFRALYELLVELARRGPLVVALDDVQFADPASLALLTDLFPAIIAQPLLLVATLPPDADAPGQALFGHARDVAGLRYQEIRVAPLGWPDARALLDALVPLDLPEEDRRRALALARGFPLHLEALAQALHEGLTLESLPAGLGGVLVTRAARLDADRQRLLHVLAVAGPRGPRALVAALAGAGGDELDIDRELATLAAGGWLDTPPDDASAPGAPGYAFRHVMLWQAAYQSTPPARRRELHRLAAAELARLPEPDEGTLEQLAYHARRAESPDRADRERALDYTLRVAEGARRRSAFDTARLHYIAAETLAVPLGREASLAEIDLALAEIASQQGDLEESERRYRSALARAPIAESPADQARLRTRLGREHERRGQHTLWMSELQMAAQLLEEGGLAGSSEWVHVLTEQAWAHYSRAEYASARERAAEAARVLAALEPNDAVVPHRAHLENVLGTLARAEGDYAGARDHFSRALETVARSGDLARAAVCHVNLGEVWRQLGDPNPAIGHYHAAREYYERIGRQDGMLLVDNNTGLAYLQSGDLESARRLLAAVIERSQALGYNWLLAETHYGLGEVLLALGDLDGARTHGTLALTISERHGNAVDRALAQRLLARVLWHEGDLKAARLRLRELVRTFETIGEIREVAATALDLAEALGPGGAPEELAALLEQAEALATRMTARDLAERVARLRLALAEAAAPPAAGADA